MEDYEGDLNAEGARDQAHFGDTAGRIGKHQADEAVSGPQRDQEGEDEGYTEQQRCRSNRKANNAEDQVWRCFHETAADRGADHHLRGAEDHAWELKIRYAEIMQRGRDGHRPMR